MKKIYFNLTNGIELFSQWKNYNFGFVRIQSTALEQKRWDFILQDLDSDFLFNLAIGTKCYVLDCSQKKKESRVLYQGLPFIKYSLERTWFKKIPEKVWVKKYNASNYFNWVYNRLEGRTKKKMDYYKKFMVGNEIKLFGKSFKTENDGYYEFYKSLTLLFD